MKKSVLPVDHKGYYGRFGGAYVPEVIKPVLNSLTEAFEKYADDPEFQAEFRQLLRDYVGRPTPLYYAKRLSEHFGTNIYLKREDLCHTGAHKINNAIGQILLAKRMGKKRVIAETGAGQHGVATATVCALMNMDCIIYMGAMDIERQRPNVERMKMLGAKIRPVTEGGAALADAVTVAINDWCADPEAFYLIGSAVGPHPYPTMVAHFQSIISEEIRKQLLEQTGSELPTHVIACVGGGSNAAGAYFHFLNEPSVALLTGEAAGLGLDSGKTAATLKLGKEGVLHGANTLVIQTPDGDVQEAYSISAGLDYPAVGPLHAYLVDTGRAKVVTVTDDEALEAARLLTRLEGIIPALESSHALGVLSKVKFRGDDVVVINLSGRGDKDMQTYLAK